MARQLQVADDLRIQQRYRVGGDRIAKTRMKFLGDRRAAHHVARLEYGDFEPRRREIRGAHQPIVAAADDDGVTQLRAAHDDFLPLRQPALGARSWRLSGMSSRMRRAKLRNATSPVPNG